MFNRITVKKSEVENEVLVQFLMYLKVTFYADKADKLLLIEAEGFSENAHLGVPQLIPTKNPNLPTTNGLLELKFVVKEVEYSERQGLNWKTQTVYNMAELPENLKGVKVKAAENADIAIINTQY